MSLKQYIGVRCHEQYIGSTYRHLMSDTLGTYHKCPTYTGFTVLKFVIIVHTFALTTVPELDGNVKTFYY